MAFHDLKRECEISKESAGRFERALSNLQKNLFLRPSNPVTISVSGDMVEITLKLVLKSGYRLPKVAEQVQMTVKENVQNMTGVVVSKVHVVAAGLAFDN